MKTLLALLCLCATLPAHAGLYLKAFGGVNYLDHKLGWHDSNWQDNLGYVVGGSLGTSLSILSLETEVALRRNEINSTETDITLTRYSLDGCIDKWTLTENLLISLPFFPSLAPYVGVGAGGGYDLIHLDAYRLNGENPNQIVTRKDRKLGSVVQGIAGLSLNCIPFASLSVEYRFMSSFDMRSQQNHAATASLRLGF